MIGATPFWPKTISKRSGVNRLCAYCETMLRAARLAVLPMRRAIAAPRALSPSGDLRQSSRSGCTVSSISASHVASSTSGNCGRLVTARVKRSAASWYSVPSSARSTPGLSGSLGASP